MDQNKIGNFLSQLRKESNYTQSQLAEKLSVSPQAVSKWERGESLPDIPSLSIIASLYSISVDEIVKGERNPSSEVRKKEDYGRLFSPIVGIVYEVVMLLLYIGFSIFIFYSYNGVTIITSYANLYDCIFKSHNYLYGNYILLFTLVTGLSALALSGVIFLKMPKKATLSLSIARNSLVLIQGLLLIAFVIVCGPLPFGDYAIAAFSILAGLFFWLFPWLNPLIGKIFQKKASNIGR